MTPGAIDLDHEADIVVEEVDPSDPRVSAEVHLSPRLRQPRVQEDAEETSFESAP